MHGLFIFYGENSFAAPRDFCFTEYRLKWLFKRPTPDLERDIASDCIN